MRPGELTYDQQLETMGDLNAWKARALAAEAALDAARQEGAPAYDQLLAIYQDMPPCEPKARLGRLLNRPPKGDVRRVVEALGFDPENHHNAAACPYCQGPDQ